MITEKTCQEHRSDVFGQTDMKEVAKEILSLRYDTLRDLMYELQGQAGTDGANDIIGKREQLGVALLEMSKHLAHAWKESIRIWRISKKYM